MVSRSLGASLRSRRARRLPRDERTSGSRSPMLTRSSSLSNGTVRFLSRV